MFVKIFLLFITFFITLNARENPFFPSVGEKDISYTTNVLVKKEPLKRATITLPSTARVIKSVKIEFQNLDGSMETKKINLDNSVDWHLPIFVSQNYALNENQPVKKTVVKKEEFKKLFTKKYTTFYVNGKTLKIVTKDKLLRNFLLVEPHRIVCDFKRFDDLRSYTKKLKNAPFKSFRIGNHQGYYRIVIELDGYYKYKLSTIKDGYMIKLL